MIPRPYIAKWKDYAPWKQYAQVEQDLIISRILIEVFSDTFLKENLAFRGGTALHKLYLNPAIRYSEDINLVQIKSGPIKPIINRLGEIITFFYEDRRTDIRIHSTRLLYRFISEYEQIRLRLKIEINTREHFHTLPLEHFSLEINNPWYSGKADIQTYSINELLATKLRALYQRKKGRDLFDLYYANQHADLNFEEILMSFKSYMKFDNKKIPTKKQLIMNLEEKRYDKNFLGDMEGLLRDNLEYNPDNAFDWLKDVLIADLD